MSNEASTAKKVRQAVACLAPAIVELGADPVQLHSFFDRVEATNDKKHLFLAPIAADLLPRREIGPVRVHCEHASAPWVLIGRSIVPVGHDAARIDLTDARLEGRRRTHPLTTGRRHLSLVTPVVNHGSDANVFPIGELGADSCVLDTSIPFELGQFLPMVEIVGDRHLLRRCAASVFEIVPWCTPDGARRFRCVLRLSEIATGSGADMLETLEDPARVRRVLEFAAMSGTLGWYETPGAERGEARFLEAGRDELTLTLYPPREPAGSRFVKLGFSLFASEYEANVRVLQESTSHVKTAFPLNLRRGRTFRQEHRRARSPDDLHVCFRNPVTGTQSEHPVVELSLHKLACEVVSESELLWVGLPLDDAYLRGQERDINLGEVKIESLAPHGRSRRVELAIQNPHTQKELTNLVRSVVHPAVSIHDGQNFRSMLGIYKDAGLFAPHMRDNLDPIVPQAKRVWHAMHQPGTDLVQTFVHGPPETPDGAASVLRAWERGWVAQHVVNVSQQFNNAAGHVTIALVDYVQRQPDGQHLIFFVKSDNRQMNSFQERFLATTGTSEAAERRTLQFWQYKGSQPERGALESTCRVRPLVPADEPLVAHAAERLLGEHGSAALSFKPGEFMLPDTRERFDKLGIARMRVASLVGAKRNLPMWAVIEEITSQGVNFTWMLNASWVFPIHGDLDTDHQGLRAALKHVLDKPHQSPTGDVFLNTVGDVDEGVLQSAGFEKLAEVYMYTLNRTGINRMFYYLSDRYGEIDARTQLRQARRSGIRLRSGESLTSIAPKVQTG